jgi:hypothetical protein
MNFGSYETIFAMSGVAMAAAGLILQAKDSKQRLARLVFVGFGVGMVVYAFYVAAQTSGIYYFPIQLAILPWLILSGSVYELFKSGKSRPDDRPAEGRMSSILIENFAGFSALRPEVLLRIAENCIHGLSEDGVELHAVSVDRHALTLEIRPTASFLGGDVATRACGQILVETGEVKADGNSGYPISASMVEENLTTSHQASPGLSSNGLSDVVGVRVYRKFLRSFAGAVGAADPLSEIEFGNVLLQGASIRAEAQSPHAAHYTLYETSEHIESDLTDSLARGVSVTELRDIWDDWHESGRVSDGQRLTAFRFLNDAEEW